MATTHVNPGDLFKIRTTDSNYWIVAPTMASALKTFESRSWDKKPIVMSVEKMEGTVILALNDL